MPLFRVEVSVVKEGYVDAPSEDALNKFLDIASVQAFSSFVETMDEIEIVDTCEVGIEEMEDQDNLIVVDEEGNEA